MKRIIIHWTAGAYKFDQLDYKAYHFAIDGDGVVHSGYYKPEDNENIADGKYAKHTRGTNEGSIGVSVCSMGGAVQSPLNYGKWPLKKNQWDKLVETVAGLCKKYKIPVTTKTVLSHAEVEKTLGNKQLGKWDISVLPFDKTVVGATAVGNLFRAQVAAALSKLK